ncbi:acyltransferase [bacterium]|nr:acyltransferase [bacterium]MCP5462930.1 acyltransferase [bacterium]
MKSIGKKVANVCAVLCVLPVYGAYLILRLFLSHDHSFQGLSQFMSLFPGILGNYLRRAFYCLTLKRCSWNCCICFGTLFSSPLAEIGSDVYIGTFCTLGDVTLGNDVLIGSNVDIINGAKQHFIDDIETPIREQGGEYPKVTIGNDTWIGNGALISCNVGKKCVIGAHSVVVKPIEDFSIAVGNPARIIKKRNE